MTRGAADYADAGRHGVTVFGVTAFRPHATLDDFLEHVDHVAQLTGGTDHIGIGTDMSLGTYPDHPVDPWGTPDYLQPGGDYGEVVSSDVRSPMRALRDFNSYPQVLDFADRLLARGYDEDDVRKILGENFLRVFAQTWK